MNIKKITTINGGFGGCTVVYLREEEKNGHPFINEVTEKRKHPIHLSLETMFKDLRYHLLEITGLLQGDEDKMEKDYAIQECEVTGIEFDASSFTIIGQKKRFADKYIKLKTCKVDDGDMYLHFETVQALIQSIVEETKEYLAGTKKVDDVEVLKRWVAAGRSKELTEETLASYNSDQLKEFAVRLIENKFGGMVLIQDDAKISEEEIQEVTQEIQDAQQIDEIEITEEETIIPVPAAKKEKKPKKSKEEIAEPIPAVTNAANPILNTPIAQPIPNIDPAF